MKKITEEPNVFLSIDEYDFSEGQEIMDIEEKQKFKPVLLHIGESRISNLDCGYVAYDKDGKLEYLCRNGQKVTPWTSYEDTTPKPPCPRCYPIPIRISIKPSYNESKP